MEYKPSHETSLKNLRIARSLSQSEVAEAIGTSANTVSRWERGIATPSLYYRRKLADLFGLDPQELFSDLNGETDETTVIFPLGSGSLENDSSDEEKNDAEARRPSQQESLDGNDSSQESHYLSQEPETVGDLLNETKDISQGDNKIPPTWLRGLSRPPKIPRWVYIPVASIMIFMLVLGAVVVLPSLLYKSSTDLFPPLCSSNFQSTNTRIVPTPATSTSPDGEPIGLSEGASIFDLQRSNQQEVQDKLQAALNWVNNPQGVVSSLKNAMSLDQPDAEAQIYLENWQVLGSNHPHITFVVGVNFASSPTGASRDVLQGAYTAQKACNDRNQQDDSKTQIVLMIANIGGRNDSVDALASSAKVVANQIADQESLDPTIVGITGWPRSSDSINVNHQLKIRSSHLPMVSPSASSDDLEARANFFRVVPTDKEQAQISANFMLSMKRKRGITVVYDQTAAYSNNLKDDFAKDIPNNMVKSPVPFTGGDSSTLQDALNNVLVQKPDAVFFAGYASDLINLLKLLDAIPQANNLLIMGGNALATTNSYTNPLPDMHNVYFTTFASPNEWDDISSKPPFFQEYRNQFGTLTALSGLPSIDAVVMLSYDAILTLLYGSQQVLSRQSTITPSELTQALKQITGANAIQGITGRIAFDNNGSQDPKKLIFVEHIKGTNLVIDQKQGCLRVTDNCSS